jgi:hypothetical protein
MEPGRLGWIAQNAVSLIENKRIKLALPVIEEIGRAVGVRIPELSQTIRPARPPHRFGCEEATGMRLPVGSRQKS